MNEMFFGTNEGYGLPLYCGDKVVGWVCSTLNQQFCYYLVGSKDKPNNVVSDIELAKLFLVREFATQERLTVFMNGINNKDDFKNLTEQELENVKYLIQVGDIPGVEMARLISSGREVENG